MSMVAKTRYALLIAIVLGFAAVQTVFSQTASITGRVKEKDGGALEGVLVRATRSTDEQKNAETKSNEKGQFQLTAVAAGDYVLTFELLGFRTFTTRRLSVEAGETVRLRSYIELVPERPPFSIIRGAVFTTEGLSLPNASVRIERVSEGKRLKRETVSVEGGEFTFRLPAEKSVYRITATAKGFESATKDVEVDADEVRQIALTLQRAK